MKIIFLFFLFCEVFSNEYLGTNFKHTGQHIVVKRLLGNYDKLEPPPERPTSVNLGVYVNSFYSISEQNMDYSVIMYLKQSWRDSRLRFKSPDGKIHQMRMSEDFHTKIWVPDVFFRNEKRASYHDMTVANRFLRVNSSGFIWYNIKISATFSCLMNFRKYPFDTQVCPMHFESYGYSTQVVRFFWFEDSVELDKGLQFPQFTLIGTKFKDCTQNYITGNHSCISVEFELHRDIGYFIIQIYIPSILVVILSWVSFWINIEAHPARVALGLLTVLTTTTMSGGARESLPRVSYLKAIDIWMIVCLVFVFASLLEYTIVNVVANNELKDGVLKIGALKKNVLFCKKKQKQIEEQENSTLLDGDLIRRRARGVDKFSRKAFPSMFIIFNIFYWIVCVW